MCRLCDKEKCECTVSYKIIMGFLVPVKTPPKTEQDQNENAQLPGT